MVARNGNLLKRLIAAPARRSHLLGAQLTSRLIFLIPEAGALLLFARFVLGVPMRGSVLLLAAVALLGALAFSGLGLLAASRPRTIEGVSGRDEPGDGPDVGVLGDLLLDRAFSGGAAAVRPGAAADGAQRRLRGVMLEGTGLVPLLPELALLAAWGTVSFVLALKFFRWQ